MTETQMRAENGEVGASTGASDLAAAVAALQHLDASALQRRWRALIGGAPPNGLGRPLLLRMLAYKLQAERLGDLDRVCRRELEAAQINTSRKIPDRAPGANSVSSTAASAAIDPRPTPRRACIPRPGTVLVREHGGLHHRVTVLQEGVAWKGRTYDSLSQVAFAITGTRWNGPRFFGLRDKPAKRDGGARRPHAHAELGS